MPSGVSANGLTGPRSRYSSAPRGGGVAASPRKLDASPLAAVICPPPPALQPGERAGPTAYASTTSAQYATPMAAPQRTGFGSLALTVGRLRCPAAPWRGG